MAKLETVRKALEETFEYLVINDKGSTVSLMNIKTHRYERSYGSEAAALKAISGLKSTKGLVVKKSKKATQKPVNKTKYTDKEAEKLMSYYGRKSGSYTGD